jgi:hypothetical protein
MIRYKEFYSNLNGDYDLDKHIIGLLNMGYTMDEISSLLGVDDNRVVKTVDKFAREQMNKMRFNDLMEKYGYEYEREETKTIFG